MSNGKRHIIGDECTQWSNQANCNQNGALAPSLPLPSTHVDTSYLNDDCSRTAYQGYNLRCNMSNTKRYIIGDECTQLLTAPEMAYLHHCYHCRAVMLLVLTNKMIVPEPPIRGITCVVIWAMAHVITSVTSALNGQIKPNVPELLTCTIVTTAEHSY